MATFSQSFSNNSKYTLILTVEEQNDSIDVVNNTSVVNWELKMTSGSNSFISWYVKSSVILDGETIFSNNVKTSLSANSTLILGSGTKTIRHNDDGAKTLSCYADVSTSITENYLPGSANVSGDLILTDILRKNEVTCPSFNAGESTNISIAKKNPNFTSTIRYSFGSLSGTIATKTDRTVVGWTPNASDFYAEFPSSKSLDGIVYCDTYNGDDYMGTTEASFTCYAVEAQCIPDVSISLVDTDSNTLLLTHDRNIIIKGMSDVKMNINYTLKNHSLFGSSIAANGEKRINNQVQAIFQDAENPEFSGRITDTRGYTNIATVNKQQEGNFVDYIKLGFTKVNIGRPETTSSIVNVELQGNYYNGRFASGKKKRNIEVGDDLSQKKVYFIYPDNFGDILEGANDIVVQGVNQKITEVNYQDVDEKYMGVHNGEQFYTYDTTFGETIVSEITMPDDFGVVSSVNTSSDSYRYLYIDTEQENVNSLTLKARYRETGGDWAGGIVTGEIVVLSQGDTLYPQVEIRYGQQNLPVNVSATYNGEIMSIYNVNPLDDIMGNPQMQKVAEITVGESFFAYTKISYGDVNLPEGYTATYDSQNRMHIIGRKFQADYIELTPTITGNKFTFTGQVGDTFSYKKQYEFEFYAEDELMLVSASSKPIIVTKGISIIRVGDSYVDVRGDLLHNGRLLEAYPIGSIYMSVNNTNPSTLFGGTWEQLKDRFLLGAGDTYIAGATGGEAQHKITVSEMPSHVHAGWWRQVNGTGSEYVAGLSDSFEGVAGASVTSGTGGGQPHNNMPPYLVVYMWKRTS